MQDPWEMPLGRSLLCPNMQIKWTLEGFFLYVLIYCKLIFPVQTPSFWQKSVADYHCRAFLRSHPITFSFAINIAFKQYYFHFLIPTKMWVQPQFHVHSAKKDEALRSFKTIH